MDTISVSPCALGRSRRIENAVGCDKLPPCGSRPADRLIKNTVKWQSLQVEKRMKLMRFHRNLSVPEYRDSTGFGIVSRASKGYEYGERRCMRAFGEFRERVDVVFSNDGRSG